MKTSRTHSLIRWALMLVATLLAAPLQAKAPAQAASDSQTYIVVLDQAPLTEWHRARSVANEASLQSATSTTQASKPGRTRLNVQSSEAQAYLQQMDAGFEAFRFEADRALGRELKTIHRYRNTLNGFAARLSADEARRLSKLPQVRSVQPDFQHKPLTDAGPTWLGANKIWDGDGSLPAVRGEGIVIGVIDSGINWDHSAFSDPGGSGGHDFINPLGSQKGLCSDPEVNCNDKLIGVYDFVEDDGDPDVVEENTKGLDNSGHGTHVASTALGNPLQVNNNGINMTISGVAPNANLISYRVCFIGDPDDSEDDSCQGSAIIKAIDQAVTDGVDVINYSLGAEATSPWQSNSAAQPMLNAVGSGIFIATSAGNGGSAPSSIGSPANAPWITAVANATHNRFFGNQLVNMTGGNTTPPANMIGASLTAASGFRTIVHAKDFGNALCGTGTEELGSECSDNTGATNPFPPGTFNGEIVVCDRGQYGRVEKGKNLQLAGAAGMILANVDEQGNTVNSDSHCLPSIHIGDTDGDELRTWLDTGSNHKGSITAFSRLLLEELGDRINSSSSRGPNLPPAEDILKPNLMAPGTSILGAYIPSEAQPDQPNTFAFLTGTSMASPHIAGAAALLRSVNSSWTPAMISSALELTATDALAVDFDGSAGTPHETGAGRPRLADAANAGLYLRETVANFTSANPNTGGSPRNLNLPGLFDADCTGSCSFNRTVTDLVGGRSWTAAAIDFPSGVVVNVTPSAFTLASGGNRTLNVTIDVSSGGVIGTWVYGKIRLSASGLPNAVLPVAVFASGGDLPVEWNVFTEDNGGFQDFSLNGLAEMPDATFKAGGLVKPQVNQQNLVEDPTNASPYDGATGTMTVWHTVPTGALWLHAKTLASTSNDLDLFVGRDLNNNGIAEQSEELCSSTTPQDLELCDIFSPTAGEYWMVVQNWDGSAAASDQATLVSAVIPNGGGNFNATGPGIVAGGATFDVRVAWQDENITDNTELLGAVSIGTQRGTPTDIGVIPVHFKRLGIATAKTLPLMNGKDHKIALGSLGSHNRAFIDVPQGASQLTVTASGANATQSNGLSIDLFRVDFDDAFDEAPFAEVAPGGTPIASADGGGGNGPVATVSGGTLTPGRWYAVIRNRLPSTASVTIQANTNFDQTPIAVDGYLWISVSRPGISQGIDYQPIGALRGMIWYTYTEGKRTTWYLAAGASPAGNIWVGNLLRFTNDGSQQQFTQVGRVMVTMLETGDSIFSWQLFGVSGSERMAIVDGLANNPCPDINATPTSVSGLWGKAQEGLGGASVLFKDFVHAEVHYLYDDSGLPFWLQAAGGSGNELTLSQFEGFCPTCAATAISSENVGVLTHGFLSESDGTWNLDYLLAAPLSGDIDRDDSVVKLSDVTACD